MLDTHALLWWLSGVESLGLVARGSIAEVENEVFVSAASLWEISIKRQLGKLKAPEDMEDVVSKSGFYALPFALFHAQQAGGLPIHHRDPFDRMLIAQAQAEGLSTVTVDRAFSDYGVRLIDAGL